MSLKFAAYNYNDEGRDVSAVLTVGGVAINWASLTATIRGTEFPSLEETQTGIAGKTRIAQVQFDITKPDVYETAMRLSQLIWDELAKAQIIPDFVKDEETGKRAMVLKSIEELSGEVVELPE